MNCQKLYKNKTLKSIHIIHKSKAYGATVVYKEKRSLVIELN